MLLSFPLYCRDCKKKSISLLFSIYCMCFSYIQQNFLEVDFCVVAIVFVASSAPHCCRSNICLCLDFSLQLIAFWRIFFSRVVTVGFSAVFAESHIHKQHRMPSSAINRLVVFFSFWNTKQMFNERETIGKIEYCAEIESTTKKCIFFCYEWISRFVFLFLLFSVWSRTKFTPVADNATLNEYFESVHFVMCVWDHSQ